MKWLSLSLSISLFFSLSRHIDLHSNCAGHSDLIVNFILLPLHNSYREEGRKHFREKLSWLSSFFLLIYGFSPFLYFVRFFYFISQHKNVPKVWMRLLIFHPLPSRAIHFGGSLSTLPRLNGPFQSGGQSGRPSCVNLAIHSTLIFYEPTGFFFLPTTLFCPFRFYRDDFLLLFRFFAHFRGDCQSRRLNEAVMMLS